jgi:hypothetical protein
MELIMKKCAECRVPKTASIALVTSCHECGLDRREIIYEIPADKFGLIIREIFTVIDSHKLHPSPGRNEIPTYEELLLKLQA